MSTPFQTLHSRKEEGAAAKHCQQKLQENVWKVKFSETQKKTSAAYVWKVQIQKTSGYVKKVKFQKKAENVKYSSENNQTLSNTETSDTCFKRQILSQLIGIMF